MNYFASTSNDISQREVDNAKRAKDIAREAIVLLENDGLLPIEKPCNIALFGNGVRWTVKGGTGSGSVNSRSFVTIEQGLNKYGFRIVSSDWLLRYDEKRRKHFSDYRAWAAERAASLGVNVASVAMNEGIKECEINPILEDDIADADLCIYVLARNSGEGCDRSENKGDYVLFPEELESIKKLAGHYEKFVLVLNVGGVLDMSEIKKVEGINSIILLGQLGNLTGEVLPEVLLGMVNPSGRLTDTWANAYEDYPSSATFSHVNGNVNEEVYSEGIYVGYKYFDTFKIPVIYPFGYGKSYTSFETKLVNVSKMNEVYSKLAHINPVGDIDIYKALCKKTWGELAGGLSGSNNINDILKLEDDKNSSDKVNGKFNSDSDVYERYVNEIFADCGRFENLEELSNKVLLEFKVKNTGAFAGKEVVEVFGSAPKGKMDKASKVLIGYTKTGEIAPGEEVDAYVVVDIKDMASYCENCSAWVLHKGNYRIYVGKNVAETEYVADINLDEMVKFGLCKTIWEKPSALSELKSGYKLTEGEEFDGRKAESKFVVDVKASDIKITEFKYTEVRESASDIAKKKCSESMAYSCDSNTKDITSLEDDNNCRLKKDVSIDMILSDEASVEDMVSQLSDRELALLAVGKHKEEVSNEEKDVEEIAGNSSVSVPGAAADTSDCIFESRGVRKLVTADGPAGLRLQPVFKTDLDGNYIPGGEIFDDTYTPWADDLDESKCVTYYQYCTAIPIAWSLAMTWSKSALYEAGDIVGGEMEEYGVDLWLAPGMNIHRNPLCGRNFEYYSEDAFVAGMCSAIITEGVQAHKGKGTTIKHFAANNQEDNRFFVNNIMSERALREIYLRGFEICVRRAKPRALMTSYNLINGYHSSNSFGLVQNILKDEWGYSGLVMSDWCTTMGNFDQFYMYEIVNPKSAPSGCVYAGNDLIMPGCTQDVEDILKAVQSGEEVEGFKISRADLEACAASVIRCVVEIERSKLK